MPALERRLRLSLMRLIIGSYSGSVATCHQISPLLDMNCPNSSVASSNAANSSLAIVGNTITVTITASEAIGMPSVTIAGQGASVQGSGRLWAGQGLGGRGVGEVREGASGDGGCGGGMGVWVGAVSRNFSAFPL